MTSNAVFPRVFDLIFDHPDFLVIHKYSGISVHKDEEEKGLLSIVAEQTGNEKLYLIHRLDKMTSGLLLLGKHAEAASQLSQLFAHRQVEKYYLALCAKKPKKKQGLIVGDMEKSRRSAWKLLPSQQHPAVTQFFSHSMKEGVRAFLCKPYTGKTHQIRVALRSLGSGIIGDPIYGQVDADRGYLHALSLAFEYQGKTWRFFHWPTDGELWSETNLQLPAAWSEPHTLIWPTLPTAVTKAVLGEIDLN